MKKKITIRNAAYPALLSEIHDPPKELFCKGDVEFLRKPCIAVVGTRRFSEYGEYVTRMIIEDLAAIDVAIVSGLAKGIDAVAHEAALDFGLPTIAVLGGGIDNIYPRENHHLAARIERAGLLVSEYDGDRNPSRLSFPQRNRIVSGMSIATIVVEAPEKSGALITARFALEQGREIFAVPGDVDRERSLGTLRLVQRSGAYPIADGRDVIDVLSRQPSLFKPRVDAVAMASAVARTDVRAAVDALSAAYAPACGVNFKLSPQQEVVLAAVPLRRGARIDQMHEKAGIPVDELMRALSSLEIAGVIKMRDGKYSRNCR